MLSTVPQPYSSPSSGCLGLPTCRSGSTVRMCTASTPAPLRTKAALSLPCFLACYNRALLSDSKSPFQSPACCIPLPYLSAFPARETAAQPSTCLSPSLRYGDPEDLATEPWEPSTPGCSLQQAAAQGGALLPPVITGDAAAAT